MKIKVAVVMGGYSEEYVISLRSGQLILDNLDANKYEIFAIHILKEGWHLVINDQKYVLDKNDFSAMVADKKIVFDVVINTVHGTPGEDGHLQAYWKLLNIPFTGCSFYQSALTFNKRDTLSVLSKFNIPKANSIYTNQAENIRFEDVKKQLGTPFFVKPNQSGSSLGVSKVYTEDEFKPALAKAFQEDADILIESFLKGREISVGVLKYKGKTTVLGITEIVPKNDFFDYEAKYLGASTEITPAELSSEIEKEVFALTQKIYDSLGMTGFSRVDYILVDDKHPFMIEINTNPGLSPQSIFPQQANYAGIKFADLFDNEIEIALNRK